MSVVVIDDDEEYDDEEGTDVSRTEVLNASTMAVSSVRIHVSLAIYNI
jgi:hypothetical protein